MGLIDRFLEWLFGLFGLRAKGNGGTGSESLEAGDSGARPGSEGPLPYRRKDYLCTRAEREFYEQLTRVLGSEYRVFLKVRIADLLTVPRGTANWQRHFNRISAKHIDFVIADPILRPVLAVELDDPTHRADSRQKRDAFVQEALKAAGLPLVNVEGQVSDDQLRKRLNL
jgi:hypothetical protein